MNSRIATLNKSFIIHWRAELTMSNEALKRFLADHPKLISALVTLLLLWSQFGSAVASGGGHSGP